MRRPRRRTQRECRAPTPAPVRCWVEVRSVSEWLRTYHCREGGRIFEARGLVGTPTSGLEITCLTCGCHLGRATGEGDLIAQHLREEAADA